MKRSLFFLLLIIAISTKAQKKTNPQPYAKTITADDARKHLYILAGKEMQGRETATPGQKKAAAYIEEQFKSFGLLPGNNGSYQMTYPVYRNSSNKSLIEINGTIYKQNEDFAATGGGNFNTSQYFSEIVFAGHGISDSTFDDYEGVNAVGKLVVIVDGIPASYKAQKAVGTLTKIITAQRKGAAALLIVSDNAAKRPGRNADMYRDLYRPTQYINTYFITEKMAASLIEAVDWSNIQQDRKTEKLIPKVYLDNVHLQTEKTVEKLESSNVLGLLEGTDLKDEYVFITGHYDHLGIRNDTTIFYGADDDGSGTTAVLELAQAFAKAKAEGKGPRRSIVFMTVSGEEEGLWGSEYYTDHPVYPLDKTSVDLNIDMIGRIGDGYLKSKDSVNYVYVIGDDKLSTDLTPITEQMNKKNTKLVLDRKYNDPKDPDRIYYRSDHYNFAAKGVPIIFYFNGTHADYHRPTDTPDKINYNLWAKRAQLVFYTAWEMANRNDMLKRDLKLDK